jgi:hypothetical protein
MSTSKRNFGLWKNASLLIIARHQEQATDAAIAAATIAPASGTAATPED